MSYAAKVIADSIADGVRLTTLEATMPRIVLAEFNTHRMFSRNSASSRAIPVEKRIAAVLEDPFVPASFGSNQKGMQAGDALAGEDDSRARDLWGSACAEAVSYARALAKLGVHKQLANRLIEPFSWHTVVCTATEWENYFALRCSSLAQPEIRIVSEMMEAAMKASTPEPLAFGDWHLPYIDEQDYAEGHEQDRLAWVSAARCARVSYLTHDGKRDLDADEALGRRLFDARHMSPFEHPSVAEYAMDDWAGNFRAPWKQLRKTIEGEAVAPREVTNV